MRTRRVENERARFVEQTKSFLRIPRCFVDHRPFGDAYPLAASRDERRLFHRDDFFFFFREIATGYAQAFCKYTEKRCVKWSDETGRKWKSSVDSVCRFNEKGSVRNSARRLLIELFDFYSTQPRNFSLADQAVRTRATVNLCECVCAGVVERKRRKIKRCVVKITLAVRKSGVTREQNRTETKRNAKKKKK